MIVLVMGAVRVGDLALFITIMGKRWGFRFVRRCHNPAYEGECDPPYVKGKEIRIRRGMTLQEEVETVIHEVMHAADWYKDEDWVRPASHDLAKILFRLYDIKRS